MKELIIMVGPPGCGKSTWVNQHMKRNPEKNYVVVSSDAIIEEWAAEQKSTYSELFEKAVGAATMEMKHRARQNFYDGRNVIWDQTMMSAKNRKTPIQMCRSIFKDYVINAVVFSLMDSDHKKRIEKRTSEGGKTVPSHVVEGMMNRFQMPTKDEGFTKITVIKK